MRFRQVHLDFHTSEAIPNVGSEFSAQQFQEELRRGSVDSITLFSKCHHGWAYHPSQVNEIHPHLEFDLLRAQIEAAHAIGVKTPVYLSAGLDEKEARRHPEWLARGKEDQPIGSQSFLVPGYHALCLHSPYLDILLQQIEEVVHNYEADGIFLDIVSVRDCHCHTCLARLIADGKDPMNTKHIRHLGEEVYAHYTRKVRQAIDCHKPGLPVFHNGGHITRGRSDLARMNTHLELESLPTGGWGYDHFPLSARYAATLGMDYLGMTGKFQTTWGEFGGFKHPNALRYESALSLAMGAKCSVGDQLHPSGRMDPATYGLIGAAYREVKEKEAWCDGAVSVADVALLSLEAAGQECTHQGQTAHTGVSDAGAVRVLLEGHFLFNVVDADAEFEAYKVLILPDYLRLSTALAAKIKKFVAAGGQVFATGESGLSLGSDTFALDLGARWTGTPEFRPDYFRPGWTPEPLEAAAFVQYAPSQTIALTETGTALGHREEPYFNRTWQHFSSHQHTPSTGQAAGPGMVQGPDGIYFAWAVFEDYATKGSLLCRKVVEYALNLLLGNRKTLETSLGAQGIVTLTRQRNEGRDVVHLLYGSPVKRGTDIEVIEDLPVIQDITVSIQASGLKSRITMQPQGEVLEFVQKGNTLTFSVPRLECHQIVEISE